MSRIVLPKTAPMGGISEVPSWTEATRILVLSDPAGCRVARVEILTRGVDGRVMDSLDDLLDAIQGACRPQRVD